MLNVTSPSSSCPEALSSVKVMSGIFERSLCRGTLTWKALGLLPKGT